MKTLFTLALACLMVTGIYAQSSAQRVFDLGQVKENQQEQLFTGYSQTLLEASDNDIELAFTHWLDMMQAIDAYADKINYDIKGVRVWMQVFWGADGTVDHLGFLLRPDSRHVDKDELRAFFSGFARDYKLPLSSDRPFSHYTGATFPTVSERAE